MEEFQIVKTQTSTYLKLKVTPTPKAFVNQIYCLTALLAATLSFLTVICYKTGLDIGGLQAGPTFHTEQTLPKKYLQVQVLICLAMISLICRFLVGSKIVEESVTIVYDFGI